MNANHHFEIGKDHAVCQDYAISSIVENGAYAIVCDGCSSSPQSDFGARALALSATRTLTKIGGSDMNYDLFGKVTIRNLEHIGDTLPLHPKSLDATLLAAWVKDKTFKAYIYGDGVFFHQSSTTLRIVHVDFESNWPAYLSYHLDKLRLKEYETTILGSKRILDLSLYIADGRFDDRNIIEVENFVNPFEPVAFNGLVERGDIIGVCSDGVNSFKRADGLDISWYDVARQLVDYKSVVGVFVQRRIQALKKQWAKEQTTHYDDVGMAAIVI